MKFSDPLETVGRLLAVLDTPEPGVRRSRRGLQPRVPAATRYRRIIAHLQLDSTATIRELAEAVGSGTSTSMIQRDLEELEIPTDAGERAAMFSFAAGYETGVILGYIAGLAAARRREEEELRAEERP